MIPGWARVVVSLALLAFLVWWLPVDRVWAAMQRIRPTQWLFGFVVLVVGQGLAALKWAVLLRAAGAPVGFREIFRAHQAGLLSNIFLPSVIGGDVVRLGVLARRSSTETAVASGLADRVLDAGSMVLLPAAALVLGTGLAPESRGLTGRIVAALLGLAVLALAAWLSFRWLSSYKHLPKRFSDWLSRFRGVFRTLLSRPGAAILAFGLSIVAQSLFVLVNAHLGVLMGISIPLAGWFLAWPLAKLVAMVPVSLGGIGVREGALAFFLMPLGVDPSLAVAESFLWESMLIAQALLAGLLVLWLRPTARALSADGNPPGDSDGGS